MNSNVVHLPDRGTPVLTKRALAQKLGCSTRTVELRAAEGMPALEGLDRFGRRLYDLRECERWLAEGRAKPRPSLADLEARVKALEDRLGAA